MVSSGHSQHVVAGHSSTPVKYQGCRAIAADVFLSVVTSQITVSNWSISSEGGTTILSINVGGTTGNCCTKAMFASTTVFKIFFKMCACVCVCGGCRICNLGPYAAQSLVMQQQQLESL